ncbi:MAG: hypothetical protein ACYDAE_28425 [Steroidobacteraceae bacterium]
MSEPIQAYPLQWPPGWRQRGDGALEVPLQPWAGCTLIDPADAAIAMNLRLYAHRSRSGVYVRTDVYCYGKRRTYLLHRLIVGAKRGELVDHENGDGLGNRRLNLRRASPSQNTANSRPRGRYSGFKGVSLDVRRGKWIAQIGHNYRHISIGSFDDELVAAAAYDIYARALHGEFARTNLGVHLGVLDEGLERARA